MRTVYHVLGEEEPFSERNGGAISRWAANVLRDGTEIVVCPSHDDSWGFPQDRLYRLPYWEETDPVHPVLYRIHWSVQKQVYLFVFRPLLERMKPGDVLYFHNRPECASVIATVAAEWGIQVMLHMHNSLLLRASKHQLAALKKTPIVFCSQFLLDEVNKAYPNHFTNAYVVYNGADSAKFTQENQRSSEVPEIIYAGRLVPYKGVHVLLKAMSILEKDNVAAHCRIVGGAGFGSSRPTRYVRSLERICPRNSELVGYMSGDQFAAVLRDADVFCAPSIWNDPFPMSILEAMSCGLPVVASSVGGIPEALKYGGGVLINPDDPVALADALKKLVGDETYRKNLSAEALHASRSHFLWSNVRTQYDAVMDKVVS